MTNSVMMTRKLLTLAIILPLAAVVGYKLATPDSFTTVSLVGVLVFILCIPIFIRWHHPLLICSWNAAIIVFFLPGLPPLWIIFSGISVFFAVMNRLLTKQETFIPVPSIAWPLVILAIVVLFTATVTGGIGLRSMGGQAFGGKRYFFVLASILGFFALISQRVPPEKAKLYGSLFLLSGLTFMIGNLIYPFPPLYFLYILFPADFAVQQAMTDFSVLAGVTRYGGVGFAGAFLFYYLLMRFGVRELLNAAKPWRWLLMLVVVFMALLGGFRSILIMCLTVFFLQFLLEGLHRTRLLLVAGVAGVLVIVALVAFSERLPLSVQRSLSVVPFIEVDPIARYDAEVTIDWRLQMWRLLLPEVPKYFWIGKGWSLDPTELYLLQEAVKRGLALDVEATMASGGYHSGPLTLMIHLGILGVVAFVWFAISSVTALYRNYRFGSPELRHFNAFLLAYFLMRLIYFALFYGHFAEDLFIFTGVAGLSISLNGGVARITESQAQAVSKGEASLIPAPA